MHGFKGERVLMRVHIGERDKYQGEPLYWAIVQLLRKRHYAGATVTKGIMSFGASSRIHTAKFLELSLDLPIVVECVDTAEKIQEILPELDKMVGGGLITLERVQVIMYRPHEGQAEQPDDWSVDIKGPATISQNQISTSGIQTTNPRA